MTDRVVSLLSPEEAERLGGLPAEAIAGALGAEDPTVDTFRPNPQFIAFMHRVIRTAGPEDLALQAAAREQQEGWVYIIDLRTPDGPQGRVPPEDIIGGFQVVAGRINADSYWANERHRVWTRNGLVRLPPSLRAAFVAQLTKVDPRAERESCSTCLTESPSRCGKGHCLVCVAAAANGVALCRFCGECVQCNGGHAGDGMCNTCAH